MGECITELEHDAHLNQRQLGLFEITNGCEVVTYFISGSSRPVQWGQPNMVFSIYTGTCRTKLLFLFLKDVAGEEQSSDLSMVVTKDKVCAPLQLTDLPDSMRRSIIWTSPTQAAA